MSADKRKKPLPWRFGAFYHYFDSKLALLDALIERMRIETEQLIMPIEQGPHLPALDKLQRFFDTLGRWKTTQKAFILELLPEREIHLREE